MNMIGKGGTWLEVEDYGGFFSFAVLERDLHDDLSLAEQSLQLLPNLIIDKNTRNGHLIPYHKPHKIPYPLSFIIIVFWWSSLSIIIAIFAPNSCAWIALVTNWQSPRGINKKEFSTLWYWHCTNLLRWSIRTVRCAFGVQTGRLLQLCHESFSETIGTIMRDGYGAKPKLAIEYGISLSSGSARLGFICAKLLTYSFV